MSIWIKRLIAKQKPISSGFQVILNRMISNVYWQLNWSSNYPPVSTQRLLAGRIIYCIVTTLVNLFVYQKLSKFQRSQFEFPSNSVIECDIDC